MIDQTGLPYLRVTSIDPTNAASVPFSRVALIDPTTGAYIGSGGAHPGYPVGAGTFSTFPGPVSNTAVASADLIYLYPFVVPNPITFTAGQARVTVAGTGSSMKTAIWANGLNTAAGGYRPIGAPLFVDNAGVATTTVANVAVPIAGTLPAGIVWIGTKHTGTLPSMAAVPAVNNYMSWLVGAASPALGVNGLGFSDLFANNMPTFTASSAFVVQGVGIPIVGLTT